MSTDSNDTHRRDRESSELPTEQYVFEWDAGRPLTHSLVSALDAVVDHDMVEERPLEYYVDTDALNALFSPHRGGRAGNRPEVRFSYDGYEVVVQSDERIRITERSER